MRPAIVFAAIVLGACSKAESSGPGVAPAVSSAPAPPSAPVASAGPLSSSEPTRVAAQHVLVAYRGAKGAPADVKRSKADAKKRADEVRTKALAGADFALLAAEYSDDATSKARQGSVGAFTRDKMVKEFSDAAFALPVDGVSGVVESPFGFHVIKRNQ